MTWIPAGTWSDILTDPGLSGRYRSPRWPGLLWNPGCVTEKHYDVALLDLKMPGMDGLTLYREIRRLRAETVAIIVTAFMPVVARWRNAGGRCLASASQAGRLSQAPGVGSIAPWANRWSWWSMMILGPVRRPLGSRWSSVAIPRGHRPR